VSYQQLLKWAESAAMPADRRILADLNTWIDDKVTAAAGVQVL
jgi:hypothetical protein